MANTSCGGPSEHASCSYLRAMRYFSGVASAHQLSLPWEPNSLRETLDWERPIHSASVMGSEKPIAVLLLEGCFVADPR